MFSITMSRDSRKSSDKDIYNGMGFVVPGRVVEEKIVGNNSKDPRKLHGKSPDWENATLFFGGISTTN